MFLFFLISYLRGREIVNFSILAPGNQTRIPDFTHAECNDV